MLNVMGGFDILSVRGDVNGDRVVGLETDPNQPDLSQSSNRQFNFDNVVFPGMTVSFA